MTRYAEELETVSRGLGVIAATVTNWRHAFPRMWPPASLSGTITGRNISPTLIAQALIRRLINREH